MKILAALILAALAGAVIKAFSSLKPKWIPCKWCNGYYTDDGDYSTDTPPDWDGTAKSHGICQKCSERELEEFAERQK